MSTYSIALTSGRTSLWQWDTAQTVTVSGGVEQVHFARRDLDTAHVAAVEGGEAAIPDVFLQSAGTLIAYAYTPTATLFSARWRIWPRQKPETYPYQDSVIDIGTIDERFANLQEWVKNQFGAPLTASAAADMTDISKVYVYIGSETGYTNGNWYYWDGSDWSSGGVYNSTAFETDTSLSQAGQAADAAVTGQILNSLLGYETLILDNNFLRPLQYAVLKNDLSIKFDAPSDYINTFAVTSLIPLPETTDGKLTHNGSGHGTFRAVVFYDSDKVEISGAENSTTNMVETAIPANAKYFRLSTYNNISDYPFMASMQVSLSERIQYLLKLMRLEQDRYIYDFEVKDAFVFPHTEIDPSTGIATYNSSSNYSATDFILLPDNISPSIIGSYAYTAADHARVAFYDAQKQFLSGIGNTSKRLAQFTIPNDAAFVRFGTHSTVPPESCLAVALVEVTSSSEDIIDIIRRALVDD